MLERIKCCLCYPRFIGKFFKDKVSMIFLMILLFFGVYAVCLGVRTYSSEYFDESSVASVTSAIFQGDSANISYDKDSCSMIGTSKTFNGNGFKVVFFPVESEEINYENLSYMADINIVFDEKVGYIELGGLKISEFEYKDINIDSFSIKNVQENNTDDVYYFKVLVRHALLSSEYFFNTYDFVMELISNFVLYFIFVLISYFFSKSINSTIDNKVRVRLCFYDNLIYFVVCLVIVLVNIEWLSYIGLLLPLIYTFVTFRHIVRVQVKK